MLSARSSKATTSGSEAGAIVVGRMVGFTRKTQGYGDCLNDEAIATPADARIRTTSFRRNDLQRNSSGTLSALHDAD